MIASLRGTLTYKQLDHVVLEAGGVGYKVHVPASVLAELPAEGQKALLLCHTNVREDAFQIFGFLRRDELETFELLITVNGVGPKLAMAMLSGMAIGDLLAAIGAGDLKRLQSIPGVGRKTAQRVVVELKDRCALAPAAATPAPAAGGPVVQGSEVVSAMVGLGYKRASAEKAVKSAAKRAGAGATPESLLRDALAIMSEGSRG